MIVKKPLPFHVYLSRTEFESAGAATLAHTMEKTGAQTLWVDSNTAEDVISKNISQWKNHPSRFSKGLRFFIVVRGKTQFTRVFKKFESLSDNNTSGFRLGVSVPPSLAEDVFKNIKIGKPNDAYICLVPETVFSRENLSSQENSFSPDHHGVFQYLNESIRAAELLKKHGVGEILVLVGHQDPVVFFNACRFVKTHTGARIVVPFFPCGGEKICLTEYAISLGCVFSESCADELLVIPGSFEKVSPAINEAKNILSTCQVIPAAYTIISCPMCGRCALDIESLTHSIEERLSLLETQYREEGMLLEDIGGITVAVMGCSVNGPGEAREADIGVAGAKNHRGVLFKQGRPFKTVSQSRIVETLLSHTKEIVDERVKTRKVSKPM